MILEDAVKLAMARTTEITDSYPTGRSPLYRRAGLYQRACQTEAAKLNPDYYGVCAVSPLDVNTATDLNDIIAPVPTPDLIEAVFVEDAGTSQWTTGLEINIVPGSQKDAALPPRATLRDLVLQGVSTDLQGVVSVMILYSRLADVLGDGDANTALELQPPHDELVVIDLYLYLLRKAQRIDAQLRAAAIAEAKEELQAAKQLYLDHVVAYAPLATRFARRVAR